MPTFPAWHPHQLRHQGLDHACQRPQASCTPPAVRLSRPHGLPCRPVWSTTGQGNTDMRKGLQQPGRAAHLTELCLAARAPPHRSPRRSGPRGQGATRKALAAWETSSENICMCPRQMQSMPHITCPRTRGLRGLSPAGARRQPRLPSPASTARRPDDQLPTTNASEIRTPRQ